MKVASSLGPTACSESWVRPSVQFGSKKLGYAVTIMIGAFLLFLIQPLITKMILPWFGGSAAVWSGTLVFFQVSVLAGYGYAYWLARYIRLNAQLLIHGSLLIASCAFLPILPSPDWATIGIGDPTVRILGLLTTSIGLPCFLLSSSSPLLQVWYVRRTGSSMPYRLFALSNVGSVLALLSFPFVIEPHFDSPIQAYIWSAVFILFAVFSLCVGWSSRYRTGDCERPLPQARAEDAPRLGVKSLWVALSTCASAMLMAITSHLTTNVAPIPLLWVVPLAVYLLTFILSFSSDRFYNHRALFPWLASALAWMAYATSATEGNLQIQYALPIYLIGLFLCCMLCHGELARRRPAASHLAAFYFLVSLGGALGGIFVAFIAPNIFDSHLELPLLLFATAMLSVIPLWRMEGWSRKILPIRAALLGSLALFAIYLAHIEIAGRKDYLFITRNFYGVLAVWDEAVGSQLATRHLRHGTIIHGSQRLIGSDRHTPASYYAPNSGVGVAIRMLQSQGPIRFGVIGLGAGVLAGYARKVDYLRFYEINPDTLFIAQELFSFISHAKESKTDLEIFIGDARLTLEKQSRQNYDLLVMDAFSSDAIPIHLLTLEAFDIYFEHLKADGILAVNVSNRFLDLVPVCLRGAEHVGRSALVVDSYDDGKPDVSGSKWVLIASRASLYERKEFAEADFQAASADEGFIGWTDQFSSVWPLLSLDYGEREHR